MRMFKFIQLKQVINALVPMDQKTFSEKRPDVDRLKMYKNVGVGQSNQF